MRKFRVTAPLTVLAQQLALRKLQAVNAAASRSNTRENHMIPAQWWMAIGLGVPLLLFMTRKEEETVVSTRVMIKNV